MRFIIAILIMIAPAYAGTITKSGNIIYLNGEISLGDYVKFQNELPAEKLIITSPGGFVNEAAKISSAVRDNNMAVQAVRQCNSACFLIFAASTKRSYTDGTILAVHRASKNGIENAQTLHNSKIMGEVYKEYGVPEPVISKMLATSADNEWIVEQKYLKLMTKQKNLIKSLSCSFHNFLIAATRHNDIMTETYKAVGKEQLRLVSWKQISDTKFDLTMGYTLDIGLGYGSDEMWFDNAIVKYEGIVFYKGKCRGT